MPIHPSAIIDRRAEIDPSADIGPYVVIDGSVRIGARCRLLAGAYVSGWTDIGADVELHPHAVVGHLPQDFHFGGERSYCRIGDGTIIREGATIHRGTQPESTTEVGKGCFLLAYSHIGHNCVLADGVKVYNNALIAGHVEIGANAIISGNCVVHQFVRIGDFVMVGGLSAIEQDIAPYFAFARDHGCYSVNLVGLRRSKLFSAEEIAEARLAYRILYRSGLLPARATERLAECATTRTGQRILEFVRSPSKRGLQPPVRRRRAAAVSEVPSEA